MTCNYIYILYYFNKSLYKGKRLYTIMKRYEFKNVQIRQVGTSYGLILRKVEMDTLGFSIGDKVSGCMQLTEDNIKQTEKAVKKLIKDIGKLK